MALAACGQTADGRVRLDAVFDTADGLTAGQDVRIAGATVGSVRDIRLTARRKALVSMDVDRAFAPFRADADCTIQPQSLIGEKFIQCTPGTPRAAPLRNGPGGTPTVPLARTHAPVDLDQVLAALGQPVSTRVALLVSALGGGLAGRSDDLSASIRRANPALGALNRVLGDLQADRARLHPLLTQSDRIVAALARRRSDVVAFVARSANVTSTTAARAGRLRAAVRGLPGLLAQAEPALDDLGRLAEAGSPAAAALRRAAPGAERLTRALAPFARDSRGTVLALGALSSPGRRAIRATRRVLPRLDRLTARSGPVVDLLQPLTENLRERGAMEGLMRFFLYPTRALARYDRNGHYTGAYLLPAPTCELSIEDPANCSAHFDDRPAMSPTRRAAPQPRASRPAGTGHQAPPGTAPMLTSTGSQPVTPSPAIPPGSPPAATGDVNPVTSLLDFLLGS
ncbi:MlaD family protein [Paraconexibacter antarcticus]|uniref:MlaD family protein n=1 Tax=Paraconexibacter antarcticus TaxID=2949664 RepID=A0ABY5DWZ3_9ACTN|nr:MlaD family protein [Paraconexibacter antarcticus]UTI66191.1 MlaD family protein [Paraconexibacter antarcticus]